MSELCLNFLIKTSTKTKLFKKHFKNCFADLANIRENPVRLQSDPGL